MQRDDAPTFSCPPLSSHPKLTPADARPMELCTQVRRTTAPPMHSNFLACCVLAYRDSRGATRYIKGVNGETPVVGACMCSERAAMLQLRLVDFATLDAVYITTSDDNNVISPGMLCREYMSEMGDPSLRVVLFTSGRDDPIVEVLTLAQLYPHPPLYRRVGGTAIVAHAAFAAACCQPLVAADWALDWMPPAAAAAAQSGAVDRLYDAVAAVAARPERKDVVYPLRYAAGALYADGTTSVVLQNRLLEYGCSNDACQKLSALLEAAVDAGNPPVVIVQCDQSGVMHAPHARGRAYLNEYGHDDVVIPVHTAAGLVELTTVGRLTPMAPKLDVLF